MVIRNHIAYRFLTDSNLWMEMLEDSFPNIYTDYEKSGKDLPQNVIGLYHCLCDTDNKSYIVSNSVVENLDMLKVNKKDDHYNWDVFKHLPDQKITFIFQDGSLLRMVISHNTIWFCHIKFKFKKGDDNHGLMHNVMFYIEKDTMALCDHFNHPDVIGLEEHIYKFLCFFYLTENTEEIIPPGRVHGTRKTGKTSNDFKFPITIVTSKWNITTIRTEAFGVRGHFRVQPYGSGSRYEIIFIAPFEKNGYTRRAKSLTA
jgi:hypothetical protein